VAKGKPEKKPEECEEGSPGWMTTFGDMMTLLLTFFVLLVSMSVIREEEFEAAKKSIKEVFLYGYWRRTKVPVEALNEQRERQENTETPGELGPDVIDKTEVQRIKQQIDSRLEEIGLGGLITSYVNVREVRIRIPDRILFGVDSAELKDLFAYEVLYGIAGILKDMDYCINIEGHTADKDLVGDQFKDLWELSTARALTVLRYFEERGIESKRLSAVGHGASRPAENNSTFRGRALNRRVEIVVRDMTPSQVEQRYKSGRGR
jgi:chemotaxis protein MotB